MRNKTLRFATSAVALLSVVLYLISCGGGSKQSYQIVATGQVASYDGAGNVITPKSGDALYGQDADYLKGAKMSYKDNGDGTVTDKNTGLMWIQTPPMEGMTWAEAKEYCENLEFAGYSDWRMPTLKELYSISDFSSGWPYLDTMYFKLATGVVDKSEQFWADNKYAGITVEGRNNAAFGVNHVTGHIKAYAAGGSSRGGNGMMGGDSTRMRMREGMQSGERSEMGGDRQQMGGDRQQMGGDRSQMQGGRSSQQEQSGRPTQTEQSGRPSQTEQSGRPSQTEQSGRPSQTEQSGRPSQTQGSERSQSQSGDRMAQRGQGEQGDRSQMQQGERSQRDTSRMAQRGQSGDRQQMSGDRQQMGERSQQSGDRQQMGERSQQSGDRQQMGERSQQSGDRQQMGERSQQSGDRQQMSGDRSQMQRGGGMMMMSSPMAKHIRPVRGAAYGENDFVDNGDGTITDNATALMWAKDDNGEGIDWVEALPYAEGATLAGYSDWRLPNVKELQSIVDYSRAPNNEKVEPAIDPIFNCTPFVNEAGDDDYGYYWTGTSACFRLGAPYHFAWYVAFGRAVNNEGADFHGAGAVRFDLKSSDSDLTVEGGEERGDNFVRLVRNIK